MALGKFLLEVMAFSRHRCNLRELEVSQTGNLTLSFILALFGLGLLGCILAVFVFPEDVKSDQTVQVISSPLLPKQTERAEPNALPFRVHSLPVPPLRPQVSTRASQAAVPLLATTSVVETEFLLAESEEALATIARLKEEEQERIAARLAQEEDARKAAEEEALLAQQKEIAQQEEVARREKEQAIAAKVAQDRQAAARAQAQEKAQAAAREKAVAQAESEARRIALRASVTKTTTPSYPSSARKSGHQGTTKIQATVTASGKVSSPRIVVSSGHQTLDSSALAAVKKYRFNPARNGLGNPIADQVVIPITFQLH